MITMIPIGRLEPHPDNPRKDLGDLSELVASIKSSGLLQNLTVVPSPADPEKYRIIIGHRRHAACLQAGDIHELPCVISEMPYAEQIATMLAENIQRNALTLAEQVGGVQMMLDLGESVNDIASKSGMSKANVRSRAAVAKLPLDKVRLAADNGITLFDLLEVSKLESEDAREKVLGSVGSANFRNRLEYAKDEQERQKFIARIMPGIQEAFPGITEWPEHENVYNGQWSEIWRHSQYPQEAPSAFPTFDPKSKYRVHNSTSIIRIYTKTKQVNDREKEERMRNAWLKDRKEAAAEMNERCFNLRADFVRRFKLSDKSQLTRLLDNFMSIVTDWKEFTSGVGHYRSGWRCSLVRDMLAIPYEPDRNKRESFSNELDRRGVSFTSFLLAWALCGGVVRPVEKREGWCNTYNATWNSCEELDDAYALLCDLGYQMSDFEKSLQNSTHEFFNETYESASKE